MKAKHLFYTMALASAFAACTNEELILDAPQLSTDAARPTVANVSLELGNAESRMSYKDGAFEWVNGDQVAVMLMDQNNTGVRYGSSTLTDGWARLTWLERYHLVDYVHTNYPFELQDGVWKTDANMLEGNYFLVYPAAEFDGKRQAYFDISEQKQYGNTAQSRMDAYAKNQRFVGYARLDAAAGASSLRAQMSEVLAPVRVNIQSNCTEVSGEPLQIRKIVLTHPTFHSQFTIDPTTADYKEWNLIDYSQEDETLKGDGNTFYNDYDKYFNYANYLTATGIADSKDELYVHHMAGSCNAVDYVLNYAKFGQVSDKWSEKPEENQRRFDTYYYDDAIRAVVKPLWKENWSENVTKYIEVYTYADQNETPYTLKSGANAKLGVVAMVPSFNDWNAQGHYEGGLELYIYTNKGLVGPVDLSVKHTGNTGSSVQTTDAILAADPRIDMNTVTVIIDDDDIVATPDSKLINNTDDLANYVDYYTKNATNSRVDVEITNDIVIDDALAAKIIAMKEDAGVDKVSLHIASAAGISKKANVKLATKTQTKIMEWLDLDENVLVQILDEAVIDLTPAARNYLLNNSLYILVDNGAVLNIIEENTGVGGWGTVSNFAATFKSTFVTNNGTVNVKATVANHAGLVLFNNATFNVETGAYISLAAGSENLMDGTINVAETARMGGTTEENVHNHGIIVNKGEIYNVENCEAITHSSRIIPGRVIIDNVAALTTLKENKGQVIYNVLPTIAIDVKDGDWANEGMYIFETSANVTATALANHYVTDAIINGAVLSTTDVQTNLRHLTLNNNSTLITGKTNGDQATIKFSGVLPATQKAWDNNYASKQTFVTNGDVKFVNVVVSYNGQENETSMNEGKITSLKAVKFERGATGALGLSTPCDINLNSIEMTIGDGTAASFTAGNFYAPLFTTSTIWVRPNATLSANNGATSFITIND